MNKPVSVSPFTLPDMLDCDISSNKVEYHVPAGSSPVLSGASAPSSEFRKLSWPKYPLKNNLVI